MRALTNCFMITLLLAGRPASGNGPVPDATLDLEQGEFLLVVAGTNDIHGQFHPSTRGEDRRRLGGFEWFAGYLHALRQHLDRKHGHRAQLIVLDAGDGAQGSLLSNHSEGLLMVDLMNQVGYTAAVAGNHGFDFGPVGWLDDKVAGPPRAPGADPLGALRRVVERASFAWLGVNVTDRDGSRFALLEPSVEVRSFGRRKVVILGLECPGTPATTVAENVEDLAFGDGRREIPELVESRWHEGRGDVFVMVAHEGGPGLRDLLVRLPPRSDGEPLLDAVIAGHTHGLDDGEVRGTPFVQSRDNGRFFGLIELVLRRGASGRLEVVRERTRRTAGIPIWPREGTFMGEAVLADPEVVAIRERYEVEVRPIAGKVVGEVAGTFGREGSRTSDSVLGNVVMDLAREIAGTEVAVMGSGDLRAELPGPGPITYAALFDVLPKNLRLVILPRVPVSLLARNLERSIRSCGGRGALQVSGLSVEFERHCPAGGRAPDDRGAHLIKITLADGRVVYERRGNAWVVDPRDQEVSVATTDFVLTGRIYPHFKGLPTAGRDLHLRDALAAHLAASGRLDPARYPRGRYRNRAE